MYIYIYSYMCISIHANIILGNMFINSGRSDRYLQSVYWPGMVALLQTY